MKQNFSYMIVEQIHKQCNFNSLLRGQTKYIIMQCAIWLSFLMNNAIYNLYTNWYTECKNPLT